MKTSLSLLFCSLSIFCLAQNAPLIEITSIEVDQISQEVEVNYQLESDTDCEVWLKFSEDGGEYFEIISQDDLSGDVGEQIGPNASLSVTWGYSEFSSGIADVQLKIYAGDDQEVDIQEMVDQVDEDLVLTYLEDVVGERNYESAPVQLQVVRDYITEEFANAGLQTEGHTFSFGGVTHENILGRKPGARDEGLTYIIDGHFDGVQGSPGADDNASAVAGVLECLRILSQYEFEHSIRFIGFDMEEYGLIGSDRYNQNGIKPYENIEGVLNLEMIGYYSDEPDTQTLPVGFDLLFPVASQEIADDDFRGNFITAVGNVASNSITNAFVAASESYVPDLKVVSVAVPGTGTIAPDLRRSDHSTFWDAGINAIMLTDGSEFRNLNYHTPNDVIETLDLEFMSNVIRATLATAAELAIPINASSDQVDLSTVLSIGNHAHDFPASVKLFPNPTDGLVQLEIADAQSDFRARLEVFSLDGKRIHREIIKVSSGKNILSVDLRSLAPGQYLMNLHTDDTSTTLGFVVE